MSGFWVMSLILAELLPPARPGLVPRSLAILDEHDLHQNLGTAGEPTLLVPIFTRCSGSCPLTAVALKQAIPGASAVPPTARPSFRVARGALHRRGGDSRALRRSRFPRDEQRLGLQSRRPGVRPFAEGPLGCNPVGAALEGGVELSPSPGPGRRRPDGTAEAGGLVDPSRGLDRACVRWVRCLARRRQARPRARPFCLAEDPRAAGCSAAVARQRVPAGLPRRARAPSLRRVAADPGAISTAFVETGTSFHAHPALRRKWSACTPDLNRCVDRSSRCRALDRP